MNLAKLLLLSATDSSTDGYIPVYTAVSSNGEITSFNSSFPTKFTYKGLLPPHGMSQYLFRNAVKNLIEITFKNIETIPSYGFYEKFFCGTYVNKISFPKLKVVEDRGFYDAFFGCNWCTSATFPELTTVTGQYSFYDMFHDAYNIRDIYFPKLTTISDPETAFYRIGEATLTVHFPKNLSSLNFVTGTHSTHTYATFVYDL